MTKQAKDAAFFVAFCMEEYGVMKHLTGQEVMAIFARCGLVDYLSNHYDVLHTQGRQWLMEDIEEYIERRKGEKE